MKFSFYVQQFGKEREKKFDFIVPEWMPKEDVARAVLEVEQFFNTYSNTRVHIEQVHDEPNPKWTKANEKQAEDRFIRDEKLSDANDALKDAIESGDMKDE